MLRGGAFLNQSSNVRSANRNNNQPDNRNNNIGFRPASTLRQATCLPCRNSQAVIETPCEACGCKVQAAVLCRAEATQLGQIKDRPGRSGRSQDSNALPGHVFVLSFACRKFSIGSPD